MKVGLDLKGLAAGKAILAVTSVCPSEGKTTIAANLSHLTAQNDQRVLLIDCDLHNATLSRLMTPTVQNGLLEVLNGRASLDKVLYHDQQSGLWLLPIAASSRIMHTSLLISSERMLKLLEWARVEYDLVILDLPPLAPSVDARAISKSVDSFIVVVEWGQSSVDAVKNAFGDGDGDSTGNPVDLRAPT